MVDTNKFNINTIESKKGYGKFELTPLLGGLGHTLGNSLRRVIFISVPGAAITKIKIKGANHLFTTLPGVKEDLVEVSLNLKKIKFTYDGDKPINLKLDKKGPGPVTAADIECPSSCQPANPDQLIATLADPKTQLKIDLTVEKGVGYTMAKEQKTDTVGEIILDAAFSPIIKVNYQVEPTRLAKKSNFDKLIMEVWTDGSIEPLQALKLAAKKLIDSLNQVFDPKEFEEEEVVTLETSPSLSIRDMPVDEIELPLRVTNALKKAGYTTIDSLIKEGSGEVMKAKNVGEKSIKIIDKWLKERNLSW